MTETIQQVKENIAILQEKLQKLEELQRTKSPAEEAFRKVYYRYPDKLDDKYGSAWDIFEKGYNAANVSETPQGPEQTEKSLKEAFVKAQQTEEWKETQRKIDAPKESWMNKSDEELIAMLEKNPPDCLKFVMGKTLEQIITRWWCDTFTGPHEKWTMEECIDDLIDQIELFLPRSQSSEGTQNIDTVVAVEAHNELLQKIKSKFRNKKDT